MTDQPRPTTPPGAPPASIPREDFDEALKKILRVPPKRAVTDNPASPSSGHAQEPDRP